MNYELWTMNYEAGNCTWYPKGGIAGLSTNGATPSSLVISTIQIIPYPLHIGSAACVWYIVIYPPTCSYTTMQSFSMNLERKNYVIRGSEFFFNVHEKLYTVHHILWNQSVSTQNLNHRCQKTFSFGTIIALLIYSI